ncbi:hypothetical protein IAT38_002767 [Cryptococcus sp. DSM 104549]
MPSPLLYTPLILIISHSPALALPPLRRQVSNNDTPSAPTTTVSPGGSGDSEGGGVRASASAGPTTTASTMSDVVSGDSGDGGDSTAGLSVSVVIPVVVIIVVCVLLAIGLKYRARIRQRLGRRQPGTNPTANSSMRTLTAEQLSGTPSRIDVNDVGGEGGSAARAAGRAAATAGGRGGRRGGARRARGDHLRRTESGRSVRTLPVYSKEAGDEELVLVRHRTNSTYSDESYTLDPVDENVEQRLMASQDSSPLHTASHTPLPLSPPPGEEDIELQTRPSSPDAPPHSAPAVPSAGSEAAQGTSDAARTNSITRRGWGEAPTYLEAMSSPSFPSRDADLEAGAGVPPPNTSLRTRTSSTFRDLLSRAGWGQGQSSRGDRSPISMSQHPSSATALPLLQPITSRHSTSSSLRPGSVSLSGYTSPWQSSLSISSPLPNTAVRASFDSTTLPRAGLSDDQMRFLSSNEAVNLAGIRLGEPPEGKRRRRSTNATMLSVMVFGEGSGSPGQEGGDERGEPPTWDQAENERRNSSALSLAESSRSRNGSFGGGEQVERARGAEAGEAEPQTARPEETATPGGESERASELEGEPRAGEDTLSPLTILSPSASHALTPTFEIEPPTPIASAAPSRVGSMVNPVSRSG